MDVFVIHLGGQEEISLVESGPNGHLGIKVDRNRAHPVEPCLDSIVRDTRVRLPDVPSPSVEIEDGVETIAPDEIPRSYPRSCHPSLFQETSNGIGYETDP